MGDAVSLLGEQADPEDPDSCATLAKVLFESGEREEAIHWYGQSALHGDPVGQFHLALHCRAWGNKPLAHSLLDEARAGGLPQADAVRDQWRQEDRAIQDDVKHNADFSRPADCIEVAEKLIASGAREEAFHWLMQAALLGDREGLYLLGLYLLERGNYVLGDYHLHSAADRGHKDAAAFLQIRSGAPRDPDELADLRKRAEDGEPDACFLLGEALLALDETRYKDEARKWIERAAYRDHPDACYRTALYFRDEGEFSSAANYLRTAIDGGNSDAGRLLDEWKVDGLVPFDDDREAAKLLESGIKRGRNSARYRMAQLLDDGQHDGIPQNVKRAAALYRDAASNGHAASMYELALYYQKGRGVRRNAAEAAAWMQKAADAGHPAATLDALYARASAYGAGEGVVRDVPKMRSLMLDAAGKGHPAAEFLVGQYYRYGAPGFEADSQQAMTWLERAADHECAAARCYLGLLTILARTGTAKGELRKRERQKQIEKGWDLLMSAARLGDEDARRFTSGRFMPEVPADVELAQSYLEKADRKGCAEALGIVDSEAGAPPAR